MIEIWEKPWNTKANRKPRKKFPVWWPSDPHFYEMEADCFPVFENTENNPDLPEVGEDS